MPTVHRTKLQRRYIDQKIVRRAKPHSTSFAANVTAKRNTCTMYE